MTINSAALIVAFIGICVMMVWQFVMIFHVFGHWASISRLTKHIKVNEPEIWESLGRPTATGTEKISIPLIGDMLAQRRLSLWIRGGGEGASHPQTKPLIEEVRRRIRTIKKGAIVELMIFVVFALVTAVLCL